MKSRRRYPVFVLTLSLAALACGGRDGVEAAGEQTAAVVANACPGLADDSGACPALGGVGIRMEVVAQGVRISALGEGLGAALADLRVDDVIIEIDGHEIAGEDNVTITQRLRGWEGTTVRVVAERGDERVERHVERRVLDPTAFGMECTEGDCVSGHGVRRDSDGRTYVGEFANANYHGQGRLERSDGSASYEGAWQEGSRSGHGIMTFPDGRTRVGNWDNDELTGTFEQTWPDGRRLEGSVTDDGLSFAFGDWTLIERDDETRYAVTRGQGSNGQVLSDFGGYAPFNYDVREPELAITCHAYSRVGAILGPVSGELLVIGLRLNGEAPDYLSIRTIDFDGEQLTGVPDDRWVSPDSWGTTRGVALFPEEAEYVVIPDAGSLVASFVSAATAAERLTIDWQDPSSNTAYSERFSLNGFAEVYAHFSSCPLEGS